MFEFYIPDINLTIKIGRCSIGRYRIDRRTGYLPIGFPGFIPVGIYSYLFQRKIVNNNAIFRQICYRVDGQHTFLERQ